MAKLTKKQKALEGKVDSTKLYPLADAFRLVQEAATAKFDESIDVAVQLGIDPKKSDQVVRGAVVMPNGTGKTMRESIAGAKIHLPDVIKTVKDPISTEPAAAILTGNLAPNGCVMKPSAAEKRLLKHKGPALVFEDYNHMASLIERGDLDVTADHVLVLKNGGPKGGPGMPEWGMLPIPRKLVKQGVRDMLRISDARMSGTSYGACILHVAPESFVGGPLAFVQNGDMIEVDAEARKIHLHVSDEEMARRRAAWKPPAPKYPRGYGAMFSEHIRQADEGCDFDFLAGTAKVPEPEIH